uniref:Uncharacterized protein n=1 Tax=Plectus sambesii TaxID=2011161 RepID=A0A914VNI7_9BILA
MVPLGTGNGRIVQKMPAVVFSDDEDDSIALRPLPPVPENRGPPVIPLATLIDFAVQKIYHELTVLSE